MIKKEFLEQLENDISTVDLRDQDYIDVLWALLHKYTEIEDEDDLLTLLEDRYSDFPYAEILGDGDYDDDDDEWDDDDAWEEDEEDDDSEMLLHALEQEIENNPLNWEARLNYILSAEENREDMIIKLQQLIEEMERFLKRKKLLLEDGSLAQMEDDDVWSYLRVRTNYFYTLITTGMLKMALKEGQELMRLDEDDTFGIRFNLMHLYVYFEEYEKAQEMHDTYDDGNMMDLPLAVMYFKQCRFDKSYEVIDSIYSVTPSFPRYLLDNSFGVSDFSYLLEKDDIDENSYDELQFTTMTNMFLYASNRFFMRWALNELDNNYDIEDDLDMDLPFGDEDEIPF